MGSLERKFRRDKMRSQRNKAKRKARKLIRNLRATRGVMAVKVPEEPKMQEGTAPQEEQNG